MNIKLANEANKTANITFRLYYYHNNALIIYDEYRMFVIVCDGLDTPK